MLRSLMLWVRDKSMLTLPPPALSIPHLLTPFFPRHLRKLVPLMQTIMRCCYHCCCWREKSFSPLAVFPPRQRPQGTAANARVQQVYRLECEWEVTHYLNVECGGGGVVIYRNFDSRFGFVCLFPRPERETSPRPTGGEMPLQTSLVSLLLHTYADDY